MLKLGLMRDLLLAAMSARAPLISELHAERTDCYRIFHGATEGLPGVTVDRYGKLLLWQTFRETPEMPEATLAEIHAAVETELGLSLLPHWNDRSRGRGRSPVPLPDLDEHLARELGLNFVIGVPEAGKDPGLFLDFRAARRWLLANAAGKDVLNTFSYTCGAGVAALAGGARSVTNLDFSATALATGTRNARANELDLERWSAVRADALPALRQLAGLRTAQDRRRQGGRGGASGQRWHGQGGRTPAARQSTLKARSFDLIVLECACPSHITPRCRLDSPAPPPIAHKARARARSRRTARAPPTPPPQPSHVVDDQVWHRRHCARLPVALQALRPRGPTGRCNPGHQPRLDGRRGGLARGATPLRDQGRPPSRRPAAAAARERFPNPRRREASPQAGPGHGWLSRRQGARGWRSSRVELISSSAVSCSLHATLCSAAPLLPFMARCREGTGVAQIRLSGQ